MNHAGSSMFRDSPPLRAGGPLCDPTGECAAAGICNMQAQVILSGIRQGLVGTMPISSSWLMLTASFGHAKASRCLTDNQDSQKSCRLRKQLQPLLSERASKAEHSWLGSVSYINRVKLLQAMYSMAKVFFPLSRTSGLMSRACFLAILVLGLCFLREKSNHLIKM